jgi:hypothetical protein
MKDTPFYRRYAKGTDMEQVELMPIEPPRAWGLPAQPALPARRLQWPMREPYPILRDEVRPSQWIESTLGESNYIGWWQRYHWRKLAKDAGTFAIAKRLRKQGVPLHVALLTLTGSTIPCEPTQA